MFDDHIVVESPGKFPGLVRADNIRYTHFSRNPRIAEFLKAYNFVKEYGEGVNRMCNELESAGLRMPEYYCNAFILQTVIYNKKTDFESTNTAIHSQNLAFYFENPAIENKRTDLEIKKLDIKALNQAIFKQKYIERTRKNILTIYNEIDTNQVFGAPEVERILGCSTTASKDIMKKLRDMDVIVKVIGNGKGKYRFAYKSEMND